MLERSSNACQTRGMAKNPKRPRDTNQLAKFIVDLATGEQTEPKPAETGKDPAAVALGRKGAIKGGKARAESLTAKRRLEISIKAAKTRWLGNSPSLAPQKRFTTPHPLAWRAAADT